MLSEDEVRRIKELRVADPVARHWLDRLLDDRRRLVEAIQALARQLHHLRGRLRQATAYLDGLLQKAEATARAPWPEQVRCPRCGAPVGRVSVDYRSEGGHVLVHEHLDGTACEGKSAKR
jgi:hypothetical protein